MITGRRDTHPLLALTVMALILVQALPARAQTWSTVNSNPRLNQVFMLNSSTGWAVGYQGAIRSTTNSGTSWSAPVYPVVQELDGVWAADASNAWAVGFAGTLLKWNGSSWSAQSSGTSNNLESVWGTDASNVWAVGVFGTILKWNGSSWSAQSSGITEHLNGVWAANSSDVWAVGQGGRIIHWNGSTWSSVASGTTGALLAVWGASSNDVWAVGFNGTILHWDGANWSPQSSATSRTLFGVGGLDANHVWAVGSSGAIVNFDGSAWSTQLSGTTADLVSIAAVSPTKAFATGTAAGYLQWNGSTWSQGAAAIADLNGVWGADAQNVWAVGNPPSSYKWNTSAWAVQPSGTAMPLQSLSGTGANSIWAVGGSGSIVKWDGAAWTTQTSNSAAAFLGVWAADSSHVWAVGKSGAISFWNGSAWAAQSSGTSNYLEGVWGTDANNVWAVGDGGIILKWNGSAWAPQASGTGNNLLAIAGTGAGSVWAVGSGGVIRYWNGGSWTGQASGTTQTLNAVWAANATNVWAVGDEGIILKWNGSTWSVQASSTVLKLNGVWGSGAADIYAVGESGTTLRFGATPPPPTVGTPGVAGLTSSSAILADFVNANGSSTAVTFEYGLTTTYGSTTTAWESPMSATGTARAQVSGLAGGTTYHFRVKAASTAGSVTSADATFTTFPVAPGSPTVGTQPATLVRSSGATLNGIVNASGSTVSVAFDFGTTTNYTSAIPSSPSSASGSSDTAITWAMGGLAPGTTYHYRARALGSGGFIYGADSTFTTPALFYPAVSTSPATNVTGSGATLNGFVSANGGPPVTAAFEYGLDTNYGNSVAVSGSFGSSNFVAVSAPITTAGANLTYHYRIKGTNSLGTTVGPDMSFVTPDPHDASLAAIALSSGSLHPAFVSGTTDYTVSVPYEVASITATPTTAQSVATSTVNGNANPNHSIALGFGDTLITIVVTAGDGTTTQTYTITVTRPPPGPGSLDFSFNGTGKVTTLMSGIGGYGYKVALQPDGKVLVAGYATVSGQDQFALARYNPDGSADSTFNGTGRVTTPLGENNALAFNLALQNDGRTILVGQVSDGTNTDFAVVRYQSDGSLDSSFNGTGKVITSLDVGDDFANGVALQSDGKIVVVGRASDGTQDHFAVVRYNSDGSLDTSFNPADHSGKVLTAVGVSNDTASSVAIQNDGKIVVAGSSLGIDSAYQTAVVRYNSDGSLDSDFNFIGKVTTKIGSTGSLGYAVRLQSDGKIVVSGAVQNSNYDVTLLRYGTNGSLDPAFGNNGIAITTIGASHDWGHSLALQGDGKIVVGGKSDNPNTFSVLRYNADGALDGTFGTSGKVITSFGDVDTGGYGVAIQGDGKIVVSGYTGNFATYKFAIARYLGDGPGIAVHETAGPNLFDGISSVAFGQIPLGGDVIKEFTITNTGLTSLTGLDITIDGSGFTAASGYVAPLLPSETMKFTVQFSPTTAGVKTGSVHITSNVTGSNGSFDIGLDGNCVTQIDNWRQMYFPGSTASTGPGADMAAPQDDGVCNLMKFATGMDPTVPGTYPGTSSSSGGNIEFSYSRNKAAVLDGIIFQVEWSSTLEAGSWSGVGVSEIALDQGDTEWVTATLPAGPGNRRFARLAVTRP